MRGHDIYGRGACDDKGQMFAHVKALEAYLQTARALPVNVKCLFEGRRRSAAQICCHSLSETSARLRPTSP